MRLRLAILLFLFLHGCSGASAQRNGDLDDLEPCRPAVKLFLIFDKEKFGYIDANGKTIVPPTYRYGYNFSEGLALVYEDDSASFIDESGNVVIRTPFKRAEDFSEGRAAVQSGELWGYIDRSGATVVQPQFEHVWPFSEGLAGVDGRVIDLQGKVVIASIENGGDDFYGWFSSGLASLSGDPGFGYVDKHGKWAIPAKFETAKDFEGGLAAVRIDKNWGYIDSTGNFVIAMRFAGAGPFSEGLAAVKLVTPSGPSKVGFIDQHGELVIGTTFEGAHRFCEGLAGVRSGQNWGFIDREGRFVIQPRFTGAGSFSGGLASVSIEEAHGLRRHAYIDRTGKIIWLGPDAYHPIDVDR